jgi:tetratricopeptide (TPR) repeat protein
LNPKNLDYRRGRASDYLDKDRYDPAIADYGVVIQAKPADPDAYADRAMVFGFKRDFPRARSDYDQAIRLSPRDPNLYIRRSAVENGAGDTAKAISDLQTAINLKPDSPDGYVGMATELLDRPHPDFKLAISELTMANDLSHGKEPMTLDMLAVASAGVGDYAGAVKWEKAAITRADTSNLYKDLKQDFADRVHGYERAKSRGRRNRGLTPSTRRR